MPIDTQSPQAEELKRELEVRANDRILVHNPTYEDAEVVWDGLVFEVPSKKRDVGFGEGNAVHPRYIAKKYVKEMTDKLLTERADEHIAKINKKRQEQGQPALTPEERLSEERPMAINNIEVRKPLYKQMWLGIYERYGEEDMKRKKADKPKDMDYEQLLEEVEQERGYADVDRTQQAEPEQDIDQLKEEQARRVSQ